MSNPADGSFFDYPSKSLMRAGHMVGNCPLCGDGWYTSAAVGNTNVSYPEDLMWFIKSVITSSECNMCHTAAGITVAGENFMVNVDDLKAAVYERLNNE
jgi:hypothetical protein